MTLTRFLDRLGWVMAGLTVFLLPFSSFPLVGQLIGSSMVAPLSLLPVLVMVVIVLVPHVFRGGRFPAPTLPILGFVLAALISAAIAFFLVFPPYKTAILLRSEFEALATLAVGVCFYLVITIWSDDSERLRFLLRWINWGGILMLAWTVVQLYIWKTLRTYPDWMWQFQGQVSSSLLLYFDRVTGFAYEPSWMAHQLNMVYLPIWLASTITGFSAHRLRIWKIRLENILLVAGVAALFLTISRIGLLTFLLMVAYLLLLWNLRLIRWLEQKLIHRIHASDRGVRLVRRWFAVAGGLALLIVYAGLLLGAAYGLSRYDARMRALFDFSVLREGSLLHYANNLVFAERLVFWQAGWEVFGEYPILGTGLGNAGYFFPEKLSAFSWALTEVRTLMYHWTALPNIKSLWIRLLAETGVVGFTLFLSWCYVLWKSARFLTRTPTRLLQMIGLAGAFVVIGFIVEGFSIDTFALPYYWVSFGLLTAACGPKFLTTELIQEE